MGKKKYRVKHLVYFCYDFETTGLSPDNNQISQCSYRIIDWEEDKTIFQATEYIQPYEMSDPDEKRDWDKKAMEVNGCSKDICAEKGKPVDDFFIKMVEQIFSVREHFDGHVLIGALGHNILNFDNGFMKNVLEMIGVNFEDLFDFSLDTMLIHQMVYPDKKHNIKAICQQLNLPYDPKAAHDASIDVDYTLNILKALLSEKSEEDSGDLGIGRHYNLETEKTIVNIARRMEISKGI